MVGGWLVARPACSTPGTKEPWALLAWVAVVAALAETAVPADTTAALAVSANAPTTAETLRALGMTSSPNGIKGTVC